VQAVAKMHLPYRKHSIIWITILLVGVYFIIASHYLAINPSVYFRDTCKLHITTSTSSIDGSTNGSNPLHRGGIHGCVRFSTKYEANHIIPWLYYHKRLGISHFHLYFDSSSSNLSNSAERKAYDFVSALPYVTLYDQYLVGLYNQYLVLHHCVVLSHLQLQADWVIEFDIDEVFSFSERLGEKPDCGEGEYETAAGALASFVSTIPHSILSLVIPRIEFRTGGVDVPPESFGQMELYVHRAKHVSIEGKVLFRANSTGNDKIKIQSKHYVRTSVVDSVSYPCGELVRPTECDNDGYCLYPVNLTHPPQEMHLTAAPFLYHYVTRSSQECHLKLENLPKDNWRVANAGRVCAEQIEGIDMIFDYGVYCSGKTISRELGLL
jgi:Glycosyltransferase family 92